MHEILVVEDDPALRHLLQMTLELEGFAVTTAATGPDAVAQATSHHPAVMLLDLELPGLDGWGVIHALDARQVTPPVVLVTGSERRGIRAAARQRGVPVVGKPFAIDDVLAAVERRLYDDQE